MTRKLILIGGVGNQLFILARALSNDISRVKLYKFTEGQKYILHKLGWKIQKDWVSIDQLAHDLHIDLVPLPNLSFAYLSFKTIIRKIFNMQLRERPLLNLNGWDLGYFHSVSSTNKIAMVKVADALKNLFCDKLVSMQVNYSTIHYRQGDMPKIYALSKDEVSKFTKLVPENNIYIISPDGEGHFASGLKNCKYVNEIDDLNLIRNSQNILMGSSTFCFWSLLTSDNVKKQRVFIKAGYHLADNLRRFDFDVYELE